MSLAIREMHIEATMRYNYTSIRIAKTKNSDKTKYRQGRECGSFLQN